MKTFIFSIILLVSALQNSYSQETDITKYLPLKTGNIWVYNWIFMGNPVTGGTSRISVTTDTVINSKKYFKCYFPGIEIPYIRIDSVSGNIYIYHPSGGCSYHPSEKLVDSLRSRLNDTVSFCSTVFRKCVDSGFVTFHSNQYVKKVFNAIITLDVVSRTFAKNLGIYFTSYGDPYTTNFTLKGCVINGIVYGDTSYPLGVTQIGTEIIEHFSLFQNYPNPFNPKSNVKFQIAKLSDVKLIVFDVLGREINTLVNEKLQPGTYEIEWDGTNYPSGVYFYKLITSGYSETRKMVLAK